VQRVAWNLEASIRVIDRGVAVLDDTGSDLTTIRLRELMREPGFEQTPDDPVRRRSGTLPWHGSIRAVEDRMKRRAAQRAVAQSELEGALLTDDERAAKQAHVDALNALPQRKTRADGSEYDRCPDGRRVEVEVTS
jgi:hypothetical protein